MFIPRLIPARPQTDACHDPADNQKGSVLIYLFIAIAVMAALSFAVSRSGREGLSTVDRERSDLQATQILDYTGMIRRSVQTMQVDGIAPEKICFHTDQWGDNSYQYAACGDNANRVFSNLGGGSVFQNPAQALLDNRFQGGTLWGKWHFSGANRVKDVGYNCDDSGDCNELLLILPYIRAETCLALNKRLNIPGDTLPIADLTIATPFTGAFSGSTMLDHAALNGRRSGCFMADEFPAENAHVFFAVLLAR